MGMVAYKSLVKKVPISPEKKTKQKDYLPDGLLPIVDQGQLLIGGYSDNLNLQLSCNLPVLIFGDHTRAVKYVDFPFGAGADGIKVLEPAEGIYSKYLYYATQYLVLQLEDRGYARHYQYIEKKELDIPPFPEQKRIVARIEELFSELDNGVETLRSTKRQLEAYRKAMITRAFQLEQETEWKRLDEISDISGGITKGRNLTGQETLRLPYLRVANVQDGYLDLTEMKSIELKASEKEKYLLTEGDVLYTEGGDRDKLGRGTVWHGEIKDCVHQNHVFKARLNRDVAIPEYVAYWSMSAPARNYFYTKGKQSVNLASINKSVLSALELPVPSLSKQKHIVQEIEEHLSVCNSIEKTIEKALEQADAMRQSILKRSFCK